MGALRHPSITDAPLSPIDDRRKRMVNYSIAMGIRVFCLLLIVVIPGWYKVIPAVGAVFIPYFAVVLANQPHSGARARMPVKADGSRATRQLPPVECSDVRRP